MFSICLIIIYLKNPGELRGGEEERRESSSGDVSEEGAASGVLRGCEGVL